MVQQDKNSKHSINQATKSRASFSGHGGALGAAGYRAPGSDANCEFLSEVGTTKLIHPQEGGFDTIRIGAAWDNTAVEESGFFGKLMKKASSKGVDLDLGCLYELQNGKRGAIQAFGEMWGDFDNAPYMKLSGDERTGEAVGQDEMILLNGAKWNEIKRALFYIYIYEGTVDFKATKPQIHLDVPGEKPMIVSLGAHQDELDVCALASIRNEQGGIILENHTEYFPGHAEMDRAFGFGLEWEGGEKS